MSRKRIGLALEGWGAGAAEPVRKGERLLFDGGIISMIPVKIAREETITSFFKTWIDLIKNLGVRRQYED